MEEQEEATGFEIEVRKVVGDEDVLRFMDSTDSYLTLLDSLSSTLRQVNCIINIFYFFCNILIINLDSSLILIKSRLNFDDHGYISN